ncbi:MAG: cellulase family glycosylhydrolase [Bacteroidia bacterium]
MKRYIIVFLMLCLGATFYFLANEQPSTKPSDLYPSSKFVSIKDGKFNINNRPFYPITINYLVDLMTDNDEYWPTSSSVYKQSPKYRYRTKDSCLMQLKADMDYIKELGFNSIRIVGATEELIDDPKTGELSVRANTTSYKNASLELNNDENYKKYFGALAELSSIINAAGLKTIFLTRNAIDVKATEDHLKKFAYYFRNDTSILAFDLFNEPLYFDPIERDKDFVYKRIKQWRKTVRSVAPNHLVTIGLTGIREVFEWDPNMLDIDFISYHPYEYEPDQVRNEIYWYGKYVNKPWIIGETAIPADNDSVSYETQKQFANKTIKQAFDCGAIGYSWWQYKDVEWHNFHANFMGIMNWKNETHTTKPNIPIEGTAKPVAEIFKIFNPNTKKENCKCFDNYYNYSQHKLCKIVGRLVDESEKPIEGGVILAWNEYWSKSYHTVTKIDGTFELKGNFPFYHWMASATRYSMTRDDVEFENVQLNADNTITINLGDVSVEKLSFIKD